MVASDGNIWTDSDHIYFIMQEFLLHNIIYLIFLQFLG